VLFFASFFINRLALFYKTTWPFREVIQLNFLISFIYVFTFIMKLYFSFLMKLILMKHKKTQNCLDYLILLFSFLYLQQKISKISNSYQKNIMQIIRLNLYWNIFLNCTVRTSFSKVQISLILSTLM
jgi:hypothetical protein